MLIIASLLYQNVITYRTLQPAAMGLALLAGRALPTRISGWVTGSLMLVLLINWDPSIRGGHVDRMGQIINANAQPGECISYELPWMKTALSMYVTLPECNTPAWLITHETRNDAPLYSATDSWQLPTMYLYRSR